MTELPKRFAVVVATDEAFGPTTAAMVSSLTAAAESGRALDLYVLDGGLKPSTADRLSRALERIASREQRRKVDLHAVILSPDLSAVAGLDVHSHISSSAYLRLLIPDLLPATVQRALYLDSDVVVRRDIGELFQLDLGGAPAAAAPNVTKPTIGTNMRAYAKRGLDPTATYINSGVIIFDLACWRTEQLGAAVMDDLQKHQHLYQFWDQCGLNAVLQNRWASLPLTWNVQAGSPVTHSSPPMLRDISVLHFTGRHKPWKPSYLSAFGRAPAYVAYRREWLRDLRRSGWYDPVGWAGWRLGLTAREARLRFQAKARGAVRRVNKP